MSQEVLKNLKTRRSVRKFKEDSVPMELLDQVIEAGLYAASARNVQSSIIIAVTDKEEQKKLREINAKIFERDFYTFYNAPMILIVLTPKNEPNRVYDGSLVLGNMMTAAHALGLGSCWIHRAKETFEMQEWQDWLKSHGIEGEYEGIGHLALGYADEEPRDIPRKPNRVFKI
jgi:nitroreductase